MNRVLEPQEMIEKKSSTVLDVSSAMTRHQEGLAEKSLARDVKEEFAMKLAPAYGDAIGHAGNGGRREKLR